MDDVIQIFSTEPEIKKVDPEELKRNRMIAKAIIQSLPMDVNFLGCLANHYNTIGIVDMKRVRRILGADIHKSAVTLFRTMIRDGLMTILSVCR